MASSPERQSHETLEQGNRELINEKASMLKVLFFARYAEELGERELQVEAADYSDVASLITALQSKGEKWQEILSNSNLIIALNQEVVEASAVLNAGDEVAFFPPVTGG